MARRQSEGPPPGNNSSGGIFQMEPGTSSSLPGIGAGRVALKNFAKQRVGLPDLALSQASETESDLSVEVMRAKLLYQTEGLPRLGKRVRSIRRPSGVQNRIRSGGTRVLGATRR
jgi:hypothetical protein